MRCCLAGGLLLLVLATAAEGATTQPATVTLTALSGRSNDWFKSEEARPLMASVLSYQTLSGGWCKNYNVNVPREPAQGRSRYGDWGGMPTIDNGATYTEIRLLARASVLTDRTEYREAAQRGIDFLLARQYPSGGWPQRSPMDGHNGYGARITFNDNAMVRVMSLLRDVAAGQGDFAWVDADRRGRAKVAFDRGVDCILKCQITVNGKLTAWCQQHDQATLAPAGARSYELPSIAAAESAGIVQLLMSLDAPDDRVRRAVHAACAWYQASKITGKRITLVDAPADPGGKDKRLVDDPEALPLWGRFYDLETNRPFFCDRDGVKRSDVAEISHERRNGYAWHGGWGNEVLRNYDAWKQRQAPTTQAGPR